MRKVDLICFIWLAIFLLTVLSVYVSPLQSQPSPPLKVIRTVWQNLDTPIKAYPGDKGDSLIVEVQNLFPDRTIKGVSATLILGDGPFTDVYGNHNATTTGRPIGKILDPTDEIKAKGFMTLIFFLDIDEDTIPGAYKFNMLVNYSIEVIASGLNASSQFVDGVPQTLVVEFIISKIQSTVTVSVSPQTVEMGQALRISGSINPIKENAEIILAYKKPDNTSFNSVVRTNADGIFSESLRPTLNGFWSVNASWFGDVKHEGNWALSSFEVRLPVSMNVSIFDSWLTAGLDNQLNISILNNGSVPISALDATLNISSPLIVHGDNHWTFNYLDAGNSTSVSVLIYAPSSSIGTTNAGSLTLNYRDIYGQSQRETFPVGLIIVGRIELVVYSRSVTLQPAGNGSIIVISAKLLNKGNVATMHVNASILPNEVLYLTSNSATYVGEVDANSQAPFILTAGVIDNTAIGIYPISVNITYRDDKFTDHSLDMTVFLTIEARQSTSESRILGFISDTELILLMILVGSTIVIMLYRRHLRKQSKV